MSQDWDIKPCAGACGKCRKEFEDKESYSSLLIFDEEEGYLRLDHCAGCRDAAAAEREGSVQSSWQGVFRAPAPPDEEAVSKETAESLLRNFVEDDDASKANVIYVLAVMLERKKILVEKDRYDRPDGVHILVFEHKKTSESFLIPDPKLRLNQLEDVQNEVTLLLGGKIPGQQSVEPPAEEAGQDGEGGDSESDG